MNRREVGVAASSLHASYEYYFGKPHRLPAKGGDALPVGPYGAPSLGADSEGVAQKKEPANMPNSFKPEVQADSSGSWAGNGLRFPTQIEAELNVLALAARWLLVNATRVVESDDLPNYRWVDGKLVPMKPGDAA